MRQLTLASFDGTPLRAAYSEPVSGRRALVVVPPLGTRPSFLALPLARLAAAFNVITWEARLILDEDEDDAGRSLAPPAHGADLVRILEHLGLPTVSLLGYCSGAALALHLSATLPRVARLALVNGAYFLAPGEATQTQYERDTAQLVALAASDRERAAAIHRDYFASGRARKKSHEFSEDAWAAYRTPRSLYRFAASLHELANDGSLTRAAEVGVPTWLYSSVQDEHAHWSSSHRVAGALREAVCQVADAGDHYELCRGRRTILDAVIGFFDDSARGRAVEARADA